ncbi:MAG: hypothetical protein AB7W47_08475 [Calditrichaceae bacterium]
MKIQRFLTMIVAGIMIFMMTGCADAPQAELDEARAALEAARSAGADRYVADKFAQAQTALDAASAEITKQNDKFAFSRNYDEAKNMLVAARDAANEAANSVEAAKEQVKMEAEGLLARIPDEIKAAKKAISKARVGKEGRAALEMIKNDMASTEASVAGVSTAMESGDYLTARDRASSILKKIASLTAEVK